MRSSVFNQSKTDVPIDAIFLSLPSFQLGYIYVAVLTLVNH